MIVRSCAIAWHYNVLECTVTEESRYIIILNQFYFFLKMLFCLMFKKMGSDRCRSNLENTTPLDKTGARISVFLVCVSTVKDLQMTGWTYMLSEARTSLSTYVPR